MWSFVRYRERNRKCVFIRASQNLNHPNHNECLGFKGPVTPENGATSSPGYSKDMFEISAVLFSDKRLNKSRWSNMLRSQDCSPVKVLFASGTIKCNKHTANTLFKTRPKRATHSSVIVSSHLKGDLLFFIQYISCSSVSIHNGRLAELKAERWEHSSITWPN